MDTCEGASVVLDTEQGWQIWWKLLIGIKIGNQIPK